MTENAIEKFFADHDRIFIFGIGNYSAALAERLNELNLAFKGFIATSKTRADRFTQCPLDTFMDHPVFLIDEIVGGNVILALPEKYQPDAQQILIERGIKNIFRCTDDYMIENVRRANELTVELVDEFKRSIPFQTVEHKPWRDVLIACLGGIGDLILVTPFIRELKRNHPTARLTLITTPLTADLMRTSPFVDRVKPFDWKRNVGTLRARMLNARKFVDDILDELNINAFDAALLPTWDVDLYGATFLLFFSRAARRIAYSERVNDNKARSNKNFDLLLTDAVDDRSLRHEVERGLVMLDRIGDLVVDRQPQLFVSTEDHSTIDRLLRDHIDGDCKLIVLGVSATAPHRIWARESFAALVNRLHDWRDDLRFVIVGGRDASQIAAHIVEHTPRGTTIDLTDRLTLRQSAALCFRASIYVGNNTGAMHLAATCGMRCVEINNVPSDGDRNFIDGASRTRPFGEGHVILQPDHALDDCVGHCSKPFAHCINQIDVETVVDAVKNIFLKGV
ncbi:MAG: glycosyltransferase family 9 protein [Selenomonadaceae bacterium]|nr:glycosyltransferase family 9 protein [Selenomonadaceae bacterium]